MRVQVSFLGYFERYPVASRETKARYVQPHQVNVQTHIIENVDDNQDAHPCVDLLE